MSDARGLIFVPRGAGGALGLTRAGILVGSGPMGEGLTVDGWLHPLNWEWDQRTRLLAAQLLCGDGLRSTRVTSGEVLAHPRGSLTVEVAGHLAQLLRVVPRLAEVLSGTTQEHGETTQIDPSGLLVLAGGGLVLTTEGLGRLDGVLTTGSRPRSSVDPEGQAGHVDAAIWTDARFASWRRTQRHLAGLTVDGAIPPAERLRGMSLPILFNEAPNRRDFLEPASILVPGGQAEEPGQETEAEALARSGAIPGLRGRGFRLIGCLAPVDQATGEVYGALERDQDPEQYERDHLAQRIRWGVVVDVDGRVLLGDDDAPPSSRRGGPLPTPPVPYFPPPIPVFPPVPPGGGPPPPPPPNAPPGVPKPPAIGDTQDPVGDDPNGWDDDDDELDDGPQDRAPFVDDTGTSTAVRDQHGAPAPHSGVFIGTGAPGHPLIFLPLPAQAVGDEGTRTHKRPVPCPLVDPPAVSVGTPLQDAFDAQQGTAVLTYDDGTSVTIRVPRATTIDDVAPADRQALVDAVLPGGVGAMPSPGGIGAPRRVWDYVRMLGKKFNGVAAIVQAALVGGRTGVYQGNLAVVTASQGARNVIGQHLVDPDDSKAIPSGLEVVQAVTAESVGVEMNRPSLSVSRNLRGGVSGGSAPVMRLDKRSDQGATDVTDWVNAGRGKFRVTDRGAVSIPAAIMRRLTAAAAASLAQAEGQNVVYVDSITEHAMRVGPAVDAVPVDLEDGTGGAGGSGGTVGYPNSVYDQDVTLGPLEAGTTWGPWA